MKAKLPLLLLPFWLFLSFLSGCRPADDGNEPAGELVRPAIYHTVEKASATMTRAFPARVAAADLRELFFPVPGVVLEVPAQEGREVKEGELLARLDPRDYESALAAAKARLENARQELERAQRLFKEDAIAQSILEQRQTGLEVAQSEFEASEKALADTRVVAPYDGIVSRVFASASETVAAGTPAVRVFPRGKLEATIAVPASLIARSSGKPKTNPKAVVRMDTAPETAIEAKLLKAELEADDNSQSYAVTFGFAKPENLTVLPGMNLEVELEIQNREGAVGVAVPLRAIDAQGEARFVWVIDTSATPNRVSRREVRVAPAIGQTVPVTSGLEAGERIVAAGVNEMVEGMAVRPWSRATD